MNIIIYGTGYVGLSLCKVLSNKHSVIGIDVDSDKVSLLNACYFNNNNLKFTDRINKNEFVNADVIFITVGTPSNEDGSTNLEYVFNVADDIIKCYNLYKRNKELTIILKSTVPCGTTVKFSNYIREKVCECNKFRVLFNPEFLREGNEIYDLTHPDRIVIGCDCCNSSNNINKEKELFTDLLYENNNNVPFVITDYNTAEMIKYAANSFLALKISFINEIGELCSKIGANIIKVAEGIGYDNRIGNKFLNSGLGWGGSCFPKDCHSLLYEGNKVGCNMEILKSSINTNDRCIDRAVEILENEISGKTFAIFGIAFKEGTDDIRDSVSVKLCDRLLNNGCKLKINDPMALGNAKRYYSGNDKVEIFNNIEECVKDVDCIVIATEWECYKHLNYECLGDLMRDRNIFDGRHLLYNRVPKGFKYLHL